MRLAHAGKWQRRAKHRFDEPALDKAGQVSASSLPRFCRVKTK